MGYFVWAFSDPNVESCFFSFVLLEQLRYQGYSTLGLRVQMAEFFYFYSCFRRSIRVTVGGYIVCRRFFYGYVFAVGPSPLPGGRKFGSSADMVSACKSCSLSLCEIMLCARILLSLF